jgi:serine phosphatase RsbU (regulator of sigma subunit)
VGGKNPGAQALIRAVEQDVAAFANGAEQSDDITLLALTYLGGAGTTSNDAA